MVDVKRKSPWDDPNGVKSSDAKAPDSVIEAVAILPAPTTAAPSEAAARGEPLRRINFDVQQDFHRQLRVKAARENVTIADVGRSLLEMWLAGEVVVDGSVRRVGGGA